VLTGEVMKKIAELVLRLLELLRGTRQLSPETVAEDDRLGARIVARLRTECEKTRSRADKIA
jgi:hypothetical protein